MRSEADQGRLAGFAEEIGARVDLVARARGTVRLPDGVLEKGRSLVAAHEADDTAGEAQEWAAMQSHMDMIADALAAAIAKQFPDKAS